MTAQGIWKPESSDFFGGLCWRGDSQIKHRKDLALFLALKDEQRFRAERQWWETEIDETDDV
jgi:hypothetical protein